MRGCSSQARLSPQTPKPAEGGYVTHCGLTPFGPAPRGWRSTPKLLSAEAV